MEDKLTHEERVDVFKTRFIKFKSRKNDFRLLNVYEIYRDNVKWVYDIMSLNDLVPIFISPTFNYIPSTNGVDVVYGSILKFRLKFLLGQLVHRKYHLYPDQKVILFSVPEFGRGVSGEGAWHLHGLLLVSPMARTKLFENIGLGATNEAFRLMSKMNRDFHFKMTEETEIPQMISYMMKKVHLLPEYLASEIPMIWK